MNIQWAHSQRTQLVIKSVLMAGVVLLAYTLHLCKPALLLLFIDGVKEMVDAATAVMVTCAPVAMSEKKRAAQEKSELPTYPIIMGWLLKAQLVASSDSVRTDISFSAHLDGAILANHECPVPPAYTHTHAHTHSLSLSLSLSLSFFIVLSRMLDRCAS